MAATAKTDKPDPQFDVWRTILAEHEAGKTPKEYSIKLAVDEIHSGFYRNRARAYAYWVDGKGVQRCRINNKDVVDERRMAYDFMFCWKDPVKREFYDTFLKDGVWPDESAAVVKSNNAPEDDTIEGVTADIENLRFEADLIMEKGPAKDQDAADRAADISVRLGQLHTKADNLRKVEGQPALEEQRRINDKWRPTIDLASIYKEIKKVVVDPFLAAERRRIDEENRIAAQKVREAEEARRKAEDERLRKIQEEEARQIAAGTDPDDIDVEAIEQKVAPPPPIPDEPEPVFVTQAAPRAGTGGRKVHQRAVVSAKIVDWDAFWNAIKTRDDVKEFVQAIADKAAKGGNPIAGTEKTEGSTSV